MKQRFSSIEVVWTYLDQIPMFSKVGASASNFGLENIKRFCQKIGNPQDQFDSTHVAGTNGKGTVTSLLEHTYRNAGYKTGAFTSPHLLKYNERIKINGSDISDEKILEFFQLFSNELDEAQLTYFEISTALAFWAFADAKLDIAIIEAGLGGRLDSTNIIIPKCSVITSIGLDHQSILGNTKIEIAREKAGIIKETIPVVVGNFTVEELEEIKEIALSKNSKMILSSIHEARFIEGEIILATVDHPLKTNFIEPINASNVATVKSVVDVLQTQYPVNEVTFIASIESFPGVPARFEQLHSSWKWFFSGAHNPEAIRSLFDTLKGFPNQKITFVLSAMKDKVTNELLEPFKGHERIFFYEQEGERAASIDEIPAFLTVESISDLDFKRKLADLKQEVVIFTGSFYFYPIVKRWLTHLN
jgi:dihydrofolate synthase/folylpolyglutamate synthase